MKTIADYFELIDTRTTPRAEREEVPAPGLSPEAPGGDDWNRRTSDDDDESDEDDEDKYVDTDGNPDTRDVDGFTFPVHNR
ncbi:MAG: hypothetical protein WCG55_01170 [bacterium]